MCSGEERCALLPFLRLLARMRMLWWANWTMQLRVTPQEKWKELVLVTLWSSHVVWGREMNFYFVFLWVLYLWYCSHVYIINNTCRNEYDSRTVSPIPPYLLSGLNTGENASVWVCVFWWGWVSHNWGEYWRDWLRWGSRMKHQIKDKMSTVYCTV